jgi:hypothetical protein
LAILRASGLRFSGHRGVVAGPRAIRAWLADGGVHLARLHADPDFPACDRRRSRLNTEHRRATLPPAGDAARPVIGRQGMEALGNLASVAVSFAVLHTLGALDWPDNYPLMLLGFLYTAWWSLCVAMIVQVLSERYEIVFHVWPPISYLYLFYAGFMFLADWIPSKWRDAVLAIDPPLQCYEMVRSGLFGYRMHAHYDIPYLTFMLAILTVVGLLLMRDVRKHLELE